MTDGARNLPVMRADTCLASTACGQGSPGHLPSLPSDFINHEPAVMFRNSGDTITEGSSDQRRLLEEAWLPQVVSRANEDHVEHESSSVPWDSTFLNPLSAEGATVDFTAAANGTRSAGDGEAEPLGGRREIPSSAHAGDLEAEMGQNLATASPNLKFSTTHRPRSSPLVLVTCGNAAPEIHQGSELTRVDREKPRSSSPKPASDDFDEQTVGLPRERYRPRPTRRRATQLDEPPVDYSVNPDRAAKSRRIKTANARSEACAVTLEAAAVAKQKVADAAPKGEEKSSEIQLPESEGAHSVDEISVLQLQPQNDQNQTDMRSSEAAEFGNKSENFKASNGTQESVEDDVFVKPAIPKSKSKKSSRRSQTTIYEDHVSFSGSQRSPSLRQQQAKRKAALVSVENNILPQSQLGDQSVGTVAREADGESQLKPAGPSTSTKKRRRKKTLEETAEPPEKTSETSNAPDGTENLLQSNVEVQEIKEDKGSGDTSGKGAEAETVRAPFCSSRAAADTRPDEASKMTEAPMASDPTPSPPKPAAAIETTPTCRKPSPASHSPIKSSSKVPMRVGLSKRHRIPSLLRTLKEPNKGPQS